ncbi:MAG: alpha-d-galacturonidase, partial [Bacteroidales bacterium]
EQTLLLGMFMSQLINPYKFRANSQPYEICGPKGEKLIEWVERESKNEVHLGETPPKIITEVLQHGELAAEAIEKVAMYVTKNKEEFERLRNDVHCYNTFVQFFAKKAKAAEMVLRYQYSHDIGDLDASLICLEQSLKYWRSLVERTRNTYLYANSMQTKQRKIPITGDNGKNKTWAEMLPYYEIELENFKQNLAILKTPNLSIEHTNIAPFSNANVYISNKNIRQFSLTEGESIFADKSLVVTQIAQEFQNLTSLRLYGELQKENTTSITFKCSKPVKVLLGYFNDDDKAYLQLPTFDMQVNRDEVRRLELCIANAIKIENMPSVNVYASYFEEGSHTLELGKGIFLVLGFIDAETKIIPRNANLGKSQRKTLDWLFY